MDLLDVVFILLQVFFLVMNFTVERCYCEGPLQPSDTRLLVKETIEFASKANPYFMARPDWLVKATCVSAYGLACGYICLLLVTLTNSWARFRIPIAMFLGAKLYAVMFYHLMEFTSDTPPVDLVGYFGAESTYMVGMGITLYKICTAKSSRKAKAD